MIVNNMESTMNELFSDNDLCTKKKLLRSLEKIDCEEQLSLIISTISKTTGDVLLQSKTITSIVSTSDFLKLLCESSPRTSAVIIKGVFPLIIEFCMNASNTFDQNLSRYSFSKKSELEMIDSLHSFLQTLIVVIEKGCTFENGDRKMLRKLYYALRRLLRYEQIPLNTLNNLGLVLVTLDYNYLELTSSFRLLTNSINLAPKVHLGLCYGFVVALPKKLLLRPLRSNTIENCSLIAIILNSIIQLYRRYPNDCIILTSCLKILCSGTQRVPFSKANISSQLTDLIISFLWTNLDHSQDIIKHLSRDCIKNLISQKDEYYVNKLLELIRSSKDLDRQTCILISGLNNSVSINRLLFYRPELPIELLNAVRKSILPSYISLTFISLMVSSHGETDLSTWFNLWIMPLLSSHHAPVTRIHLEDTLTEAIKLSPNVANELLRFCRTAETKNYLTVVQCVLVLNKLNISILDGENDKQNQFLWHNIIPLSLMTQVVRLPGSEEAIATITMILKSSKKTTSFTSDEIQLLRIFLDSNIYNLNTNQRSVFLSTANRVIVRLGEQINLQQDLKELNALFSWLSGRCIENLFPGASFSRRNIVLKILECMLDANVWTLETCDPEHKFLIFTYLSDSFDENRVIAKKLTQSTSFPLSFLSQEQLNALYTEVMDIISSARFCEHDTAIYLLELFLDRPCWIKFSKNCFSYLNVTPIDMIEEYSKYDDRYYYFLRNLANVLDKRLRSKNNEECLRTCSVYGFLSLVKYLFEHAHQRYLSDVSLLSSATKNRWRKVLGEFSELCMMCNSLSTTVVSQSSPEGYLPQEELENMTEDSSLCYTSAQRLLLISWRTVKEASLLLAFFMEKFAFIRDAQEEQVFMDNELILRIGSHLESLIRGIKHRGAFEQVYIALCQYCRCCWRCSSNNETVCKLPQKWLQNLVVCIETNAGSEELCAMRRSAGVPYIAEAILSTEYGEKSRKHGRSELLNTFVNSLLNILREGGLESKIHATNVLRALFRNKDLVEQMRSYIDRALVLAIRGIRSLYWKERNVSWLLFSSLMTKMFGVARSKHEISAKNKMTVKTFFRKYPSLYEFFAEELRTVSKCETSTTYARSSLYPILLVLQRLEVHSGCSGEQYDAYRLNSLIPLLFECSQSKVWKIRELVALAIFPFITIDIYETHIRTLWNYLRSDISENFMHGLLLQLEMCLANVVTLEHLLLKQVQPLFLTMLMDAVTILEKRRCNKNNIISRQFLLTISSIVKYTENYDEHSLLLLEKTLCSQLESALKQKLDHETFVLQEDMYVEDLTATCICVSAWRAGNAISCLEEFVRREEFRSSYAVLEAICWIVSEYEFVLQNSILQNMPQSTSSVRERAQCSEVLYRYVFTRLSEDRDDHNSFFSKPKMLHAFMAVPKWLSKTSPECCLKILFDKCWADEDSINIFVQCAIILVERSMECADIHFGVLKILTDRLLDSYSEEVCETLVQFYLKYYYSSLWRNKNQTILRLNVWTFMLLYALSPSNRVQQEIEDLPYIKEAPSFLRSLMDAFCAEFESECLLVAVSFLSWILRDIGILLDESEDMNTIFVQNVPFSLEDDLLIGQLASTHLGRVIFTYPNVLHLPLTEEHSQWIEQSCSLVIRGCSTLYQIIEFITLTHTKHVTRTSSISPLRASSWRSKILRSKIDLLPNVRACVK